MTRDDLPFSETINFLPLSPSATDRSNVCAERRGKEIAAHKHRVHTASVRRERKRAGGEGCCTVLTWNRCCSLAIVTARCLLYALSPLLERGGSALDSRRRLKRERERKNGRGKNDNDPRPVLNKALRRIHFMRNCSNVG